MPLLLGVLGIVVGPAVTLFVGFRLHMAQNEIKVSVDGRLEHAYEAIDALQTEISALRGTLPPPPVAGQSNG